jgi:hypothetical protein
MYFLAISALGEQVHDRLDFHFSLEMEEERVYNELSHANLLHHPRARTLSSPIPPPPLGLVTPTVPNPLVTPPTNPLVTPPPLSSANAVNSSRIINSHHEKH